MSLFKNKFYFMTLFAACAATSAFWSMAGVGRTPAATMVTVYWFTENDGKLSTMTRDLSTIKPGEFFEVKTGGKTLYFYGERAWAAYLALPENRDLGIRYFAKNRAPIQKCLSKIQEGDARHVRYTPFYVCDKSKTEQPYSGGQKVAYTVSRRNGAMAIDLKIGFNYTGSNRAAAFERLDRILSCVEGRFAASGLNLKIHRSEMRSHQPGSVFVTLHDNTTNREVAEEWSIFSTDGIAYSEEKACGVKAHEVAHLLGLPDRYVDKSYCPDRMTTEAKNDMMGAPSFYIPDATINDEDLTTLLSPVCDENLILAPGTTVQPHYPNGYIAPAALVISKP